MFRKKKGKLPEIRQANIVDHVQKISHPTIATTKVETSNAMLRILVSYISEIPDKILLGPKVCN